MSRFIVKTSSAKMPNSCWGRYGHVAVLEVEDGVKDVKMISERARGVVRVVQVWRKRYVGGSRSAFALAEAAAQLMSDRLNRGES